MYILYNIETRVAESVHYFEVDAIKNKQIENDKAGYNKFDVVNQDEYDLQIGH